MGKSANVLKRATQYILNLVFDEDANALATSNTDLQGVIKTNTHTGNPEVRTFQENHICTQNSTTTPLGANATFTGEWQDCLNYQEVNVSIVASHNSASNGLVFQWSADGVNVGDTDVFSYYTANGGTNYTPNPSFRYVRMVYTNGATPQTSFSLQTILRRSVTGGSFHRIDSTLKDDSDGRLQIVVPKLKTAANTYVSQTATNSGNAKMSIQEFDGAFNSLPLPVQLQTAGVIATVEARKQTPTGNALNVQIGAGDIISNLPVIMDYDHHQLHEGESFRWSVLNTAGLSSGSSKDIQLIVPNITGVVSVPTAVQKCPHFRWEIITDSYSTAYLYETPTITVNGASRTPIPMERNGSYTPKLAIHEDPTVTAVGSLIWQGIFTASKNSAGSTDGSSAEFVLKNNTTYLLRFTSGTTGCKYLIRMIWYEDLGV